MQEIRNSKRAVVIEIFDPNKSQAQQSLKLIGSNLKYLKSLIHGTSKRANCTIILRFKCY